MKQIDSQTRLKGLLRELFQLDVADLDFGLYRLFRMKRDEVEAFLERQLPAEVDRAFEAAAGAEREALQKHVDDLARRAREAVADDAILPSGEPNPAYAQAKAVKEYAEARKRLQTIEASEAQRVEVFNLLWAFFSRYYDEGDFIPRRFYGARASYAVPYNGEEVLFHWANKDQYYVKSGEAFRDYAFTVSTVGGDYRVRFTLAEATAPKDNTKGDTRFFFPLPKEATFDSATRTFVVPFHYRLPTEAEVAKYGRNAKAQEAILDEAAPEILEAVTDEFLRGALSAPSADGSPAEGQEPPTLLRRRLRHFTKKNTTDYFVHKDLGAFLRQELEFFIRDQVVHEADLEGDFEAKRRTIRVFRKLAGTLITFLAQIEDAQKQLFEKKKFVLRTDYLIPIQNVPRALWPEVLANKVQLDEWKELYALEPKSDLFNVKGKVNEQVLEQRPTLVVNTARFDGDFKRRLLETMDDVDERTDALLIHGENFQALNLMRARYRERVKCIYIDPPYNTGKDGFIYKDCYQRSSWLTMMAERLKACNELLADYGLLFCSIDENETATLRWMGEHVFGKGHHAADLIWNTQHSQQSGLFTPYHEYIQVFGVRPSNEYENFLGGTGDIVAGAMKKISAANPASEFEFPAGVPWDAPDGTELKGTWGDVEQVTLVRGRMVSEKGKLKYPVVLLAGWTQARQMAQFFSGESPVLDSKGQVVKGFYFNSAGKLKIVKERSRITPTTVLPEFGTVSKATAALAELFGRPVFSRPKPVNLVKYVVALPTDAEKVYVLLDFFAGSGTTGHAVINLNREDGGRRKFILVEMGDYFDTVLLPRIQKVMFTPEWKDGKPRRLPTPEEAERTPRLVKVLRLESYEDALHNTFSDKAVAGLAEREKAYREAVGEEEYRIRYLVKLPLEASDSMLNLAKLEHPFDYTLEVLTDYGPRTETVDLMETFHWLYGLRVHRLLTWRNEDDKTGQEKDGRSYRAVLASEREGKKRILVVWRDMTRLDPKVERPFLEARAKELGTFEEQWINGDTAAKGFASLDGLFKRLMEEGQR